MLVEIEVSGGVATVKTKSKGVHLIIKDYDILMRDRDYTHEKAPDKVSEEIWTDSEEIKNYENK